MYRINAARVKLTVFRWKVNIVLFVIRYWVSASMVYIQNWNNSTSSIKSSRTRSFSAYVISEHELEANQSTSYWLKPSEKKISQDYCTESVLMLTWNFGMLYLIKLIKLYKKLFILRIVHRYQVKLYNNSWWLIF